jgi:two-component sensor histidine kinase
MVSADEAVALGVILTGVLTNALEHAYPENGSEIRVELTEERESVGLDVKDDGAGFDLASRPRGSGLASKLIKAVAANLSADVAHSTPAGGGTIENVLWANTSALLAGRALPCARLRRSCPIGLADFA